MDRRADGSRARLADAGAAGGNRHRRPAHARGRGGISDRLTGDGLSAAAVHGADGPLCTGSARGARRPARRRPAAGLSRTGRPRLSHDVGRGPGHGFRVGVVPARAALCRPTARPAAAGALCRDGGLSPADAADGAAAVDLREQARCAVPDHRGGARAAGRL